VSLEVAVICDNCGAVLAGGRTADLARKDAKANGARTALPGGLDICRDCDASR
jgi:hypothetical protein